MAVQASPRSVVVVCLVPPLLADVASRVLRRAGHPAASMSRQDVLALTSFDVLVTNALLPASVEQRGTVIRVGPPCPEVHDGVICISTLRELVELVSATLA